MMNAESVVKLPKKAKGSRPYFFDDPSSDKMLAMLMGLVGEVSVLADRVDTIERLLRQDGVLKDGQVDSFRPDLEVRAERDARREMLLANVLRIIRQDEGDPDAGQVGDLAYRAAIDMVEEL